MAIGTYDVHTHIKLFLKLSQGLKHTQLYGMALCAVSSYCNFLSQELRCPNLFQHTGLCLYEDTICQSLSENLTSTPQK